MEPDRPTSRGSPARAAAGELKEASRLAANMGDTLEDAFETLRDAISDLTEDGPVEFVTLGDEVRDAGDDLYGSLSDLSGEMKELRSAVEQAGEGLTEENRAIFYESLDTITKNLRRICQEGLK